MITQFADKSGRGLVFAALNRAAATKGFQFAKTDLTFGPIQDAVGSEKESFFVYSANPNTRFEGSANAYLTRIDLTGLFASAGIESVQLNKGPTTTGELVAALNARFGLGFDGEDFDLDQEIPEDAETFVLQAAPGSYGFKGQLTIELVEGKIPLEDTEIEPEIDVVVPEYLTEPTVTSGVGVTLKAQKPNGTLLNGSGNPVGQMTVATNGELELALGARVWKSGNLPVPVDGHYDISIDDVNGDWNWPFSIALLQEDRPVTDLYDITLKIQALETDAELAFTLHRDEEGVYHFVNEAAELDINDNSTTESGSVVQNIQRVTFYKEHLGELTTNAAGAPIGDFIISMKAVRRSGLVEPLSVEISASVSVQEPA